MYIVPYLKKIATGEVAVLPKDYATALRELADQVERNQQLGCPLYSLGRVNQAVAHLHYQDVALLTMDLQDQLPCTHRPGKTMVSPPSQQS